MEKQLLFHIVEIHFHTLVNPSGLRTPYILFRNTELYKILGTKSPLVQAFLRNPRSYPNFSQQFSMCLKYFNLKFSNLQVSLASYIQDITIEAIDLFLESKTYLNTLRYLERIELLQHCWRPLKN